MSIFRKIAAKSLHRRIPALSALQKRPYVIQTNFEVTSNFPDINPPDVRIDEAVFENLGRWSNRIALECCETGRKLTYEELRKKTKNFNGNLRKKLKLQQGDVLAVLLPNVPEFPIAVFGAIQAGLVVTSLNPIYTPEEISRQLLDSNAKVIVTLSALHPVAKAAINICKKNLSIITIGSPIPESAINFQEFADNETDMDDVPFRGKDEIIFMPYSSGTTGLPKGVELTNWNLVSNLHQLSSPYTSIFEITSDSHQDIIPAVLPMFHIYGFTASVACMLWHGCKVLTLPKFTPESYLQMIVKHKPDVLLTVPPIVIFLTAHPAVKPEYLQPVRTIMCGAAPLGALDEEKFQKKAQKHINVVQGFGLSETSPVVCITSLKHPYAPGSVGEPVSNTTLKVVAIDDPNCTPLGPNEQGELLVKGPQVMKRYHNKPEETKDAFTEDGWLRTGDMVYYDENQMFYVTDRIKELIKVKGFQVPPAELEEIIRDYEGVADTAVIGVPHDVHGEVPKAFVVPKPAAKIDPKKLEEYVSGRVAQYKQLKGGVAFVDAIPKNASGKILRRELKMKFT